MLSKDFIYKLTSQRVGWLVDSGPENDIAISTRIRLARNLRNIPFPIAADHHQLEDVVKSVTGAVKKSRKITKLVAIDMRSIDKIDANVLLERRLISTEFVTQKHHSSLLMNDKEHLAVMINEEDHLRIQAIMPGFQLNNVWKKINNFDSAISNTLSFEFDPQLGFLTSCPTNVGTGMRASVMLHLPGLVLADQTPPLIQGIYKLGLAVRGILGEGTDNLGNLFQISNQSTLGESEEDILKRLSAVIGQIINHEKNARRKLLEGKTNMLLDNIGRAYGILKYSYSITTNETLNYLSMLRLGVDLGIIRTVDIHTVNELFIKILPAHLQKDVGGILKSDERNQLRADLIRKSLKSY